MKCMFSLNHQLSFDALHSSFFSDNKQRQQVYPETLLGEPVIILKISQVTAKELLACGKRRPQIQMSGTVCQQRRL